VAFMAAFYRYQNRRYQALEKAAPEQADDVERTA
jgi:hypothetical protein